MRQESWLASYLYPFTSVVHIGGESAKTDGEITSSGRQISSLQVESELLYFRKNYGLSAVIANVFLVTLADSKRLLIDLIKLRRPQGQFAFYAHSQLVWKFVLSYAHGQTINTLDL